jgi:tetratricopeptide (TPR) repeat protein
VVQDELGHRRILRRSGLPGSPVPVDRRGSPCDRRTPINRKKAIAEYRRALEREPGNDMVRVRLGDLLAQTEQLAEARDKLLDAARGFEKRGFEDKAIATYALAVARMPFEVELVHLLVDKHLLRKHRAQALKVLVETRGKLRAADERPQAISLLRRVLEIEPADVAATMDLAALLARGASAEAAEARRMLERLAEGQPTRTMLLRIRGALFRLSPSPASAWRWLRALLVGR